MKLLLFSVFLCCSLILSAQFTEPKFGKVEISDLSMTKYDKDTTAGALMLFNNGSSQFILSSEKRFQLLYSRHCQIKIFKKSFFSVGEFSARLFKGAHGKEELTNLKAVTYNLVDGKIVKTKLDNDNIYKTESKNYTDVKFAFPELKEGSVIELSYGIISDFLYSLRGWDFQYTYPAIWSQYSYEIPEYFEYRESSKGYLQFEVQKRTTGSMAFIMSTRGDYADDGFGVTHTPAQTSTLRTVSSKVILATKDVPAFISEPDIDCEENYIQSMEFELKSVEYPGSIRKNFTQTWESVNTQMQEDEDFGMLMRTDGFVKDTVQSICGNKPALEKAVRIYNYVQNRMKWNGQNRIYATSGLKKPFNDGVGSSAEINLLLTLMLRTAGLDANPVMFSTRDNGIAMPYYPTVSKYNSVISIVTIDGKTYLLDARSIYCPFGVLPANDINGKGRLVNKSSGDWVNLDAIEKFRENKSYNLTINSDGVFTGKLIENYDGYAGIYYRNLMNSEKTIDDYYRKIQENIKGLSLSKYAVSGRLKNSTTLTDTLTAEISDHAEMIGDKILFSPLLFEKMVKSRYTLEERKYPVDYNYFIAENYTFDYTLPEGYVVESMPASVILKLPDNSIVISYNLKAEANKIHVEYKRDINKVLFLPENYAGLKNLYDQMLKKHAEQVILKKSV